MDRVLAVFKDMDTKAAKYYSWNIYKKN